ncbi:MAG: acetyl-CoA hydrolase/transferase C-terminal domain-containing protein [Moraxellaceae bacterium]|nr:acetyl-CoA hydrolase/transferase C-terminal domain-containing protein [Moraxellaceae bacterium]
MTRHFSRIDDCLDDVITRMGPRLVLGIPLGIGKPNPLVNALYARAKANPGLKLKILTALSLEKPKASSDMESRFLDPFVARVFGNYPDLDYVQDRHKGQLPSNIDVIEFFLKSGDYLRNDYAQQNYMNSNYTHAARDMLIQGVNVLAQAVAVRERGGRTEYSLSCNPDVTLDALDLLKAKGQKAYVILVVNHELPFMEGGAIIDEVMADAIVNDPACTHTVFSAPNMKVTQADYAIGMYVSTLVKDGGTLQIGIGSLGDAIAHALILRDRHNDAYATACRKMGAPEDNLAPFRQGLYGCSEMFVNGFMALIDAGILRREVFDDARLQQLLNAGKLSSTIDENTLPALLEARVINETLNTDDVKFLKKFGIFKEEVTLHGNHLLIDGQQIGNTLNSAQVYAAIQQHCLGTRLKGGVFMHGGFFLGPRDFYEKLHQLTPERRAGINMTRISYINQLYGHESLAAAQRKDTSFVNTCMMVTLLGAAVSDGLDSGKLVSGIGGQYNFVAQAHALPDARSILMLRATRQTNGETASNIVWNYAHNTIPRHLRDIVVTEYGIADLRGQTDSEIIKRLLAISDSRFQPELLAQARAAGKIEPSYEIPEALQHNLPETMKDRLASLNKENLLPDFPFGSDFTPEELAIIRILQRMKESAEHPLQLVKALVTSMTENKEVPAAWLERLQLDHPESLKEKVLRQLFIGNV